MWSSYSSDDRTGNRLSIGSVGTTNARGISKKGNIFPLRTTVRTGPPRPREPPTNDYVEGTAEGQEGVTVRLWFRWFPLPPV